MSRRPSLVAARLAVIVLMLTLGATPTSAAAQDSDEAAVRYSGEWIFFGAVFTDVGIDPEDPMGPWQFESDSTSLLFGDFVGVDHTRITGTFDLQTGETKGYIWETFIGTYAPDRSAGVMTREGPFKGSFKTGEIRYNQRITGGEGDFAGSRGYMTVLACLPVPGAGCVATGGTYEGVWSRP